jgi:polar amino acid transport system permease protein
MSLLLDILPPLLQGLVVTVELTVASAVLAMAIAFLAGLARLSRFRAVRWAALAYIEIFRGTSALVQLFWLYFALPLFGFDISAMTAGILGLGLNTGAYGAVVVRGALEAVPRGQIEAAEALNLTPRQRLWHVVLPQAAVAMLPPWGNLFIELLKNTALVSLITISELTFQGQLVRSETLRTPEVFGTVLLLYFLLALVITKTVRLTERRLAFGLDRGGAP